MTHYLGRLVPDGRSFDHNSGLDLNPSPGPLGGPRFVMLHFDTVSLSGGAKLEVDLGYATDIFNSSSGDRFWSRPADAATAPIEIRITGGTGSAVLREYGSGEPSVTPGNMPGTNTGSQSNPDPFLHTNPYQEPIYETRLECNPGFAWRNAACSLDLIPTSIKDRVAAATGIIFAKSIAGNKVSSCTGTLIASDLFLTARHCLKDPSGEDVKSASVTFDYACECSGSRPAGHAPEFFKVLEEVAAGAAATGTNPPSSTDWVVLRLDAEPGALPPHLEMRDAALMTGEVIFTMHHPNGAVKKTQSGVHDGGSISGFDYAGGSSGSALFDASGRLVGGPLSNGYGCSVTYAPIANIKNALSNPPAPPSPLDVMVVIDRSGSMASAAPPVGRTKLQEVQDAASLFVQLVRDGGGDRLGLVTFSSSPITESGPIDVPTAKSIFVGPTGLIEAITTGGSTSIGGGLDAAIDAMSGGPGNDPAILLLTDGLQNTSPMVEAVEPSLGATKLCVIGFGSDAEIDGPLLSRVARDHDGEFTRAVDGMTLRKFFGLCFGNIFETGALSDPEHLLRATQEVSEPHKFTVCGEERITLVLGWDNESTPLRAHIKTPSGKPVTGKRVQAVRGRTWAFWRIPLPYGSERDGTWQFTVDRVPVGGEFPPPPTDVRYFHLVVCAGGPKLVNLGSTKRLYTGDPIEPLVGLHYPNGTTPRGNVELTIQAPAAALGQLVTDAGLTPPDISADAVDAFHATLQSIAGQSGELPIPISTVAVPLYDDGQHGDGAMEPDGIYGNRLTDITRFEGTYEFRAVATFGEGCSASREAFWSLHVEPGIDPDATDVTIVNEADTSGGRHGTLVVFPRDRYGNPLGPGRGDRITVTPLPGVTITGGVKDRGDGSYGVDIAWNPTVTTAPGVLVHQPDRDPAPMIPPAEPAPTPGDSDCTESASKLLTCMGLPDADVKRVRVKSVCVQVDLKDPDC